MKCCFKRSGNPLWMVKKIPKSLRPLPDRCSYRGNCCAEIIHPAPFASGNNLFVFERLKRERMTGGGGESPEVQLSVSTCFHFLCPCIELSMLLSFYSEYLHLMISRLLNR
jgi:hypothetical protein